MPEKTSPNWPAIPYPTSAGETKLGAADMEEIALRVDKILYEKVLTIVGRAASYEAKSGECASQSKGGETTTLPSAATANQIIGVTNISGTAIKITTSGGAFIYGDFLSIGAKTATVTLTEAQHIILQSDGANWVILAGSVKDERKWSARAAKTAGEKHLESATRPAEVILNVTRPKQAPNIECQLLLGGIEVGRDKTEVGEPGGVFMWTFKLNPGQEWELKNITGAYTCEASTLLL